MCLIPQSPPQLFQHLYVLSRGGLWSFLCSFPAFFSSFYALYICWYRRTSEYHRGLRKLYFINVFNFDIGVSIFCFATYVVCPKPPVLQEVRNILAKFNVFH